jgi:hypothetical protein
VAHPAASLIGGLPLALALLVAPAPAAPASASAAAAAAAAAAPATAVPGSPGDAVVTAGAGALHRHPPRPVATGTAAHGGGGPHFTVEVAPYASAPARQRCLRAVESGRGPLVAVVGASFTAGVGAGSPLRAWSVDLVRWLGWRALVVGVPGAGYVWPGRNGDGPLSRIVGSLDLASLHPRLVVVQAGRDDIGEPIVEEQAAVARFYTGLRRRLPHAELAAVTVMPSQGGLHGAELSTDGAIRRGIARAGAGVRVIDPLAGHWHFARQRGGLHPNAAGAMTIAGRVEQALSADGLRPARPARPGRPAAPVRVCELTAPTGQG